MIKEIIKAIVLVPIFIALFLAAIIGTSEWITSPSDYIKNGNHCYNNWSYQISTGKCIK